MSFTAPNIIAARIGNRVLRDYPLARTALIAYAHARVDVRVGPVAVSLRITPAGAMEPLGEGTEDLARVSFNIPLSAIPRLAIKMKRHFERSPSQAIAKWRKCFPPLRAILNGILRKT